MARPTLNDCRYAFFKRETGKTGNLQELKSAYFKQQLGL